MKISQDQVKHLKPILQKLIIEIKKEINEEQDPISQKISNSFNKWLINYSRATGHHPRAIGSIIIGFLKKEYNL